MTIRGIYARGAAFEMAKQMYQGGIESLTRTEMLSMQDFCKDAANQKMALHRGVANGWFYRQPSGSLALTLDAKIFFADKNAPSKQLYIGQIATPRAPLTNVFERRELSRKYIPSRLGPRDDVPAFSVRETMRFATLA